MCSDCYTSPKDAKSKVKNRPTDRFIRLEAADRARVVVDAVEGNLFHLEGSAI